MADYEQLLRVASGEEPADLLISSINLLNVITRDVYPVTIGICDDTIAFVVDPQDPKCAGLQVLDGRGLWAAPGLIDSHMHIESTHLTPGFFSAAVVPRGITTVAQDPHEMANVLGVQGVIYMRDASRGLPLRVLTFVPTCVPAVPGLETSGAEFGANEVTALLEDIASPRIDNVSTSQKYPEMVGLAEVMDYWGVIRRSPRMNAIVQAGRAHDAILTGHIRIQGQRDLNTYLAAGIDSDHELLTPEGILARSHLGMTIEICCARHRDNVPAMVESWRQRGHIENLVLVTDDVPPHELAKEGHLDRGVRRAIQLGMVPVDAVRAATLVPARRLRRLDLGQIAPGRTADILIISDLQNFTVRQVIVAGKIVAENGIMLSKTTSGCQPPPQAQHSVHLREFTAQDFHLTTVGTQYLESPQHLASRIGPQVPDRTPVRAVQLCCSCQASVLTQRGRGSLNTMELPIVETSDNASNSQTGLVDWQSHPELALVSVWHRHGLNSNRSFVLIADTGLRSGALATTYAHDSHNLVVLGRDIQDMAIAANVLRETGGGYVVVSAGKVIALAALPVAGLLADCPLEALSDEFEKFIRAAVDLGVVDNPLGLITSLPLPVVPSFRPTDMGLVDVENQKLIPSMQSATPTDS